MSTAAQMKHLVKPLLARNPDLALIGRVLYLRPVRHILRYVRLEAVSHKDLFIASWGIVNLMARLRELEPHPSMDYGYKIHRPGPSALWYVTDPQTQDIFTQVMENDVLPRMRAVTTVQDFVAFTKSDEFSWARLKRWYLQDLVINVALGDFDAARATCEALERKDEAFAWELHYYSRTCAHILAELWPPLKQGDRAGMAACLRNFEQFSVQTIGIEKFWEPAPYPMEGAVLPADNPAPKP